MEKNVTLYDYAGRAIEPQVKSFDLDPSFWLSGRNTGSLNADEIERNPYQNHAWEHACGWAIARNVSRLPLVLKDKNGEIVATERTGDKWGVLKILRRPNAFQTRTSFLQDIILKLIMPVTHKSRSKVSSGGQVFITPYGRNHEKVNLLKDMPLYIMAWNTDYIRPHTKGDSTSFDKFLGWKFEINGNAETRIVYQMNEIIRVYLTDPTDILGGVSKSEPAAIALIQDIQSDIYNAKLYGNNAMPTGILKSDQTLVRAQQKQLLQSWYEQMGGGNAQKTAVMGSGVDYKHIGLTNVDMQYKELSANNLEKMLASFGLNKIAIGKYENLNFATIKEGRRLLWHDTYLPMAETFLEAVNTQWIQYVDSGVGLSLDFDMSNIEALRIDYTKPAQAASSMVKDGVPVSVAYRINNIPLTAQDIERFPHLDEKPISPSPFTTPEDDTTEEEQVAVGAAKSIIVKSEERDKFSLDYIERVLTPGEKGYIKMLFKFFTTQRNEMQDKVDEWLSQQKAAKVVLRDIEITPESFLLSIPDETKKLMQKIRPLVEDQLKRQKKKLEEELNGLVEWNYKDETVDLYVNARLSEMKIVNITTMSKTQEKVATAIEIGIKENQTPQELAKAIKAAMSEVGEIRKNQSKTIARTETGIINSSARFDAFQAEGINYHEWVTAKDEKVRVLHQEADGEITIVGTPFPGVGLRFPNDPEGAPGNIINCRCVATASEGK